MISIRIVLILISLWIHTNEGNDSILQLFRARKGPPIARNQPPSCLKSDMLHSEIVRNAQLKGDLKSGNFTFLGEVKNMDECMARCCAVKKCELAYLDQQKCYSVRCYKPEFCTVTSNTSKPNNVQISLMVKNDINRKAYVTAYIVVVVAAFGAALSGSVWAMFIFVKRYRDVKRHSEEKDGVVQPMVSDEGPLPY